MKKKKINDENKSLIFIERADAVNYVKIKHPLRKNVTVYVSNIEMNLLTLYSIKAKSKEDEEYKNFILLMKMIDNKNDLSPINYR